jgi:hypothetical protein
MVKPSAKSNKAAQGIVFRNFNRRNRRIPLSVEMIKSSINRLLKKCAELFD